MFAFYLQRHYVTNTIWVNGPKSLLATDGAEALVKAMKESPVPYLDYYDVKESIVKYLHKVNNYPLFAIN